MARRKAQVWRLNKFYGGFGEGDKVGQEGSFLSGECLDIRSNPDRLTLNSLTTQETMASGATMESLPKWIVPAGGIGASNPTVDLYLYNEGGYMYRKSQGGTTWENITSMASSAGQGVAYFSVDDQLYFANLASLARYGPLGGSAAFGSLPSHESLEGLEEDNDYHHLVEFLNYICFGNGRYVGTWDGTTLNPDRIDTYRGWRVRALEVFEDYLAIGCWKGTDIADYDRGIIFYWNGYATTFNFFTEMEGGGVNAMAKSGGDLLVWAGPNADLYKISYPGAEPTRVKPIPNIEDGATGEVLPGGVTVWKGIPYFGFPGAGTATTALRGLYGYGSKSKHFAPALNLDYRISSGSVGSPSTFIGAVAGIGTNKLLVGWANAGTFGVDNVKPGTPYRSGSYESLVFDGGEPYRRKTAYTVKLTMMPLETGQKVTINYDVDRGKKTGTIGKVSYAGDGAIMQKLFEGLPLPLKFYEIKITLDFEATASAPEVTSFSLVYESEEVAKGGRFRAR